VWRQSVHSAPVLAQRWTEGDDPIYQVAKIVGTGNTEARLNQDGFEVLLDRLLTPETDLIMEWNITAT
jgi:hypothetical protein